MVSRKRRTEMPKRHAPKTRKIGREADTGKFIPVAEAKRRPKTTVVETIPPPRRGS